MSTKNLQASIRARLLRISQKNRRDFNHVLISYALERLLYRLSVSHYQDEFVLKGGMLFSCWSGDTHRATKDVDFLKSGVSSATYLTKVFTELCQQRVAIDDGMAYVASSIQVDDIRESNAYGGTRIRLRAMLANARIPVQVDIGIGDVITPAAETIIFPVLLDMPTPNLKAYPVETVLAEKFEAMVQLGFSNSRMKDFYDVWAIVKFIRYDDNILSQAIHNTFKGRKTPLPSEPPLAFTDEFSTDANKQKQWQSFVKRAAVTDRARETLQKTIDDIRPVMMQAVHRIR